MSLLHQTPHCRGAERRKKKKRRSEFILPRRGRCITAWKLDRGAMAFLVARPGLVLVQAEVISLARNHRSRLRLGCRIYYARSKAARLGHSHPPYVYVSQAIARFRATPAGDTLVHVDEMASRVTPEHLQLTHDACGHKGRQEPLPASILLIHFRPEDITLVASGNVPIVGMFHDYFGRAVKSRPDYEQNLSAATDVSGRRERHDLVLKTSDYPPMAPRDTSASHAGDSQPLWADSSLSYPPFTPVCRRAAFPGPKSVASHTPGDARQIH